MKTAVSIPNELFKRAEQVAKKARFSRSELYAKALQQFIEGVQARQITQALDEVYSSSRSGSSRLDETLTQMQTLSLAQEEW